MELSRTQVAVRSKAYFCSHLIAGVAGSYPAVGVEVHLLCLLFFM